MDPVRDLIRKLPTAPATGVLRMWGVVTAVVAGSPNTVTCTLSGSVTATAGIRYLASYTPLVNDVVLIDRVGGDLVAIGKLA